MKTSGYFFCLFVLLMAFSKGAAQPSIQPYVISEFNIGTEIGKLRAVPVQYTQDKEGVLLVYSESKEVDPFTEMFFFPRHTLKFLLVDKDGEKIWEKELSRGVMPGIWFCPVFPFDLDRDGVDEIWFVNNPNEDHPLGYSNYRLERLDAATGANTGQWKWPLHKGDVRLSHLFRNFIMGGYTGDQPVLLTAQGTYGDMKIQAWNPGMEQRWERHIKESDPGPRGSHMCPIVDMDVDGNEELMWGERCINLDDGEYIFVADEQSWHGHSDIIQPLYHRAADQWYIFTCRESGAWVPKDPPRVVMYNQQGEQVWKDLEQGHMDMGWVAHMQGYDEPVAFTVRIGGKKAGPDGFYRTNVEQFAYKAISGQKIELPVKAYNTVPVDIDGDGYHELVGGLGNQGIKDIVTSDGASVGHIGENGFVAMASRFMDHPGEQILAYYPDGTIKIWGDKNAKDTERARQRYEHPFYKRNQRQTANGYNLVNLGGI